ncbi:MAG TPA: hypothetical protein PLV25_07865, partial [Opitutales bacterium]|nr:hypothetical protein [Opitutales bacterium]
MKLTILRPTLHSVTLMALALVLCLQSPKCLGQPNIRDAFTVWNADGRTPLSQAFCDGDFDKIDSLLPALDTEPGLNEVQIPADREGPTCLGHLALWQCWAPYACNYMKRVIHLTPGGINAQWGKYGHSALSIFLKHGVNFETFIYMLEQGATVTLLCAYRFERYDWLIARNLFGIKKTMTQAEVQETARKIFRALSLLLGRAANENEYIKPVAIYLVSWLLDQRGRNLLVSRMETALAGRSAEQIIEAIRREQIAPQAIIT